MALIHHGSAVIVYSSYEYGNFDFINGNRKINENKISRIIEEIKSGNDMLRYYPIQVKEIDDRLAILDGQHRFTISKRLQLPVYYILVKEEKKMVDIAKVNSNVEKWTMQDYIQCYMKDGNNDYKMLHEFVQLHKAAVSTALVMLSSGMVVSGGGHHKEMVTAFQNGLFKVTHKKEADEIMVAMSKFLQIRSISVSIGDRSFIDAVYRIDKFGKVSIDEIAAAVKEHPEALTSQTNYKNYIYKLESIYNIGKHNRRIIWEAPKKVRIKKEPAPKAKKISKAKKIEEERIVNKRRSANISQGDHYRKQARRDRNEPKYKTIPVVGSDNVSVKVDDKTSILVKKGDNVAEAVAKYKNNLKKKESLTKQHG